VAVKKDIQSKSNSRATIISSGPEMANTASTKHSAFHKDAPEVASRHRKVSIKGRKEQDSSSDEDRER